MYRPPVVVARGLMLASHVVAPQAMQPDPLARLEFMIGRWEGLVEGQPGNGTARRDYTRALNSRFIRAVHRGERLMVRQFHVEGFVNTHVAEADSSPTRIVFTTQTIENIPSGFRGPETYQVQGPDAFGEVFENAEPGKPTGQLQFAVVLARGLQGYRGSWASEV